MYRETTADMLGLGLGYSLEYGLRYGLDLGPGYGCCHIRRCKYARATYVFKRRRNYFAKVLQSHLYYPRFFALKSTSPKCLGY